jgi:hypothetical protein
MRNEERGTRNEERAYESVNGEDLHCCRWLKLEGTLVECQGEPPSSGSRSSFLAPFPLLPLEDLARYVQIAGEDHVVSHPWYLRPAHISAFFVGCTAQEI